MNIKQQAERYYLCLLSILLFSVLYHFALYLYGASVVILASLSFAAPSAVLVIYNLPTIILDMGKQPTTY
jgi:hypothetical protein